MSLEPSRRARRPPRRRRRWPVAIGAVVAAVAAFLVGLAVGRALDDGPEQGRTVTAVRTLDPLPLPPATRTVTVTGP